MAFNFFYVVKDELGNFLAEAKSSDHQLIDLNLQYLAHNNNIRPPSKNIHRASLIHSIDKVVKQSLVVVEAYLILLLKLDKCSLLVANQFFNKVLRYQYRCYEEW